MAKERKDNKDWKASRPPEGASSAEFAAWAKNNPNRIANATERLKEFNNTDSIPTTTTSANTPARDEVVSKWRANMPQGGAGVADSAEGAVAIVARSY